MRLIISYCLIFGGVKRGVKEVLRWRGRRCIFLFKEGGLALYDGPSWNIASTMKILWLLLASLGSLWIAWVEAYILKERLLLAVDLGIPWSWCVWAILRKWDSLKEHVWMEVGDGRRC